MKYSVISADTEALVASLESIAGSQAGQEWELSFADENGAEKKQRLSAVSVVFRDGMLEVNFSDGARMVYPAYRNAADGVFVVSTALGNFRLLPMRGSATDVGASGKSGSRSIKSSMPGKVLKILCAVGDSVEAGQPLLIIEAMKMENEIRSPQAGVVESIEVVVGKSLSTGDLLVKLGSGEKK